MPFASSFQDRLGLATNATVAYKEGKEPSRRHARVYSVESTWRGGTAVWVTAVGEEPAL